MTKQRASVKGLGQEIFGNQGQEEHPVETFTDDGGTKVFNIALNDIIPNPEQPRKYFDQAALEELATSIKSKGLLQPIIVTKHKENGKFLLVAGERRYRALKIAGIQKVPCMVRSDDPLEIAIIENLQREDLNPIEEAEGLKALADKFEYSHDAMSKIVGKSRSTVTEILSLNRLPEPIKDECRTSDNWSKSVLLQVVRQPNKEKMLAAWDSLKKNPVSVKIAKAMKENEPADPRFTHIFRDPEKKYSLYIKFNKKRVDKIEVAEALKAALKHLKESE
jgi:ParB family transcriptional regulator, chromosome partitioning protein